MVLRTDGLSDARLGTGDVGSEIEQQLPCCTGATAEQAADVLLSAFREGRLQQRDDSVAGAAGGRMTRTELRPSAPCLWRRTG